MCFSGEMVMGPVSEIRTTSSVKDKRPRIKILVKKPANKACNVSEVPEVNCEKKSKPTLGTKKVTSTVVGSKADACEKKSKPTLGTKNVLQACQSSKQVPRVNCLEKSSVTPNRVTTAISGKMLNPIAGFKRKNEVEVLENCESKKQKLNMDVSTTLSCNNILTVLMKHGMSPPFLAPVDAKGLGLHDYFDIIKRPMDLGTVKEKFLNNHYLGAEQFEADIRLTFSNAMLYNPPGNWYHEAAKKLLTLFDRLWKSRKSRNERVEREIKQKGSESFNNKIVIDVMNEYLNSDCDHYTRKILPLKQKNSANLKKSSFGGQHSYPEAVKESSPKKTAFDVKDGKHARFPGKALLRQEKSSEDLKKLSIEGQHSDLKAVKEKSHKLSQRKVRNHEDMKKLSVEGKQDDLKTVKGRSDNKNLFLVKDENPERVSAHHGQLSGKALPRKVRSHEDMKKLSVEGKHSDLNAVKDGEPKLKPIRRNSLSSATKSVFSGPASQSACPTQAKVECEHAPRRKTAHDDVNAVKVRRPLTSQRDRNVQCSVKEDEGFESFPTTTGSFDATGTDLWHLSPRSLRVAKLKERFSETILKAQNHTLLEQGVRTDLQKEKAMQQRSQNEEKARIEAQIETIKSVARLESESQLQKQRRAKREALEKMEQTVFFDDNLQDFEELLIGSPLVANYPTNPLERLGLYIKEEYEIGDENDYVIPMDEVLEGEIM